ncbi:MAG: carboxypeptidase-like regulatory domain-containing protein [Bacteroidales bacterium]|nr:carboxypeptidase-like regulatory domain-containing protein [Bacteroidales bacterium]
MLRIFLLGLIYFLSQNYIYSQNLYSGKVLDAETNESIPFAYVVSPANKMLLAMTNIDGEFEFKNDSDSCMFYCMGYDSLCVSLKNKLNTIKLTPKAYKIDQAIITASAANKKTFKRKINVKKVMPWDHIIKIYSHARCVETRLILGNGYIGQLRKVYVYVTNEGEANSYFRIKIYSNLDGRLGYDITPANIIAKGRPNRWIEIDVQKYGILFPKNGLFLGVEHLEDIRNKSFERKFGVKGNIVETYCGPVVGGVMSSEYWKREVCFQYSTKDNGWYIQNPLWCLPMIGAEVIFYKQ